MQGNDSNQVMFLLSMTCYSKKLEPEVLNNPRITAEIIGNNPNTYTFTKVGSHKP